MEEILSDLYRLGIRIRVASGRIHVIAPAGSISPELRAQLQRHREELTELFQRAAAKRHTGTLSQDLAHLHDPFPLTDIQNSYWVGRRTPVARDGVDALVYFEFESLSPDLGRLTASLRRVIDQHEMLRAVVRPDGRQHILSQVPPYEIGLLDLRDLPPRDRWRKLADAKAELLRGLPRPLDTWPLFEVRAYMLDTDVVRLHVQISLLIADAASILTLFADWRRFFLDPGWEPPRPPVSYRDVVLDRLSQREGKAYVRARNYWFGRLTSLPPPPSIPVIEHLGRLGQVDFARRRGGLASELWNQLSTIAREQGLTPSVVILTAFSEILQRWSAQSSFSLTLTLFDRLRVHPRIDRIVGDFTSISLLEVGPESGTASFIEKANRLQRQIMADLENLEFGGIEVLRERARGKAAVPGQVTMPIVFTSLLGLGDRGDLAEVTEFLGKQVNGASQTPQIWIDHQVLEERGRLIVNWDTVDGLFPAGLLDDMFAAYQKRLHLLASDVSAWSGPDSGVPVPTWQMAERERANDTAATTPQQDLLDPILRWVRDRPDNIAVIYAEGSRTYGQLGADAARLAHRLKTLGASRDELVAVVVHKGYEQVVAVLGVLMSSAAYIPIDPQWPEARRSFLLVESAARIVVTSVQLREALT
nr:AMP-binding protein [Actinomycetota bacterium]